MEYIHNSNASVGIVQLHHFLRFAIIVCGMVAISFYEIGKGISVATKPIGTIILERGNTVLRSMLVPTCAIILRTLLTLLWNVGFWIYCFYPVLHSITLILFVVVYTVTYADLEPMTMSLTYVLLYFKDEVEKLLLYFTNDEVDEDYITVVAQGMLVGILIGIIPQEYDSGKLIWLFYAINIHCAILSLNWNQIYIFNCAALVAIVNHRNMMEEGKDWIEQIEIFNWVFVGSVLCSCSRWDMLPKDYY